MATQTGALPSKWHLTEIEQTLNCHQFAIKMP